jgi:4-hydroxybenzoate polyprenyltransferase
MGAAGRGAVVVAAGGVEVREPRLPELAPPPILASASAGAKAMSRASASAGKDLEFDVQVDMTILERFAQR